MALGILEQRWEHDRQNGLDIVADQVAKIFIVPEIEGTFGNLWRRHV
jgi:hypothetical protein